MDHTNDNNNAPSTEATEAQPSNGNGNVPPPETAGAQPSNDNGNVHLPSTTQSQAPPDQGEVPINTVAPIPVDDFSVRITHRHLMRQLTPIIQKDDSSEFESDVSDMTSLSSSVLDYEYENGRRYHSNRTVSLSLKHHLTLLLQLLI